jgi:hypothetical protein
VLWLLVGGYFDCVVVGGGGDWCEEVGASQVLCVVNKSQGFSYQVAEDYCLGNSNTGHSKERFSKPALWLKYHTYRLKTVHTYELSPNQTFIP